MYIYSRVILVFFTFLHTSFLLAEDLIHYYDTEQGFIEYQILGGAQLTNETNLNIQGSSTLRFKSWGKIRQEEDSGTVVTTGAINFTQEVRRIEKHIDGKVITVDYDNEQLFERKSRDKISSLAKETEGLRQVGQEVVAGVLCKIWIGPSVKKCLYRGIVLKQESRVLGVSYLKEATNAVFDKNVTSTQCILPSFPKNLFGMISDKIKTKKSNTVDNVCKVFKNVVHEVDTENKSLEPKTIVDAKKRKKFMNKITESIFKKQKEILPELLVAMKKSRECLHLMNDVFDKQICIKSYRATKNALGIESEDYAIFEDYDINPLDSIEDAIIDFAPRIPCVKRSKNFTDISNCMK